MRRRRGGEHSLPSAEPRVPGPLGHATARFSNGRVETPEKRSSVSDFGFIETSFCGDFIKNEPSRRAAYDRDGAIATADVSFEYDPAVFFAALFGSERFDAFVGQLALAQLSFSSKKTRSSVFSIFCDKKKCPFLRSQASKKRKGSYGTSPKIQVDFDQARRRGGGGAERDSAATARLGGLGDRLRKGTRRLFFVWRFKSLQVVVLLLRT